MPTSPKADKPRDKLSDYAYSNEIALEEQAQEAPRSDVEDGEVAEVADEPVKVGKTRNLQIRMLSPNQSNQSAKKDAW